MRSGKGQPCFPPRRSAILSLRSASKGITAGGAVFLSRKEKAPPKRGFREELSHLSLERVGSSSKPSFQVEVISEQRSGRCAHRRTDVFPQGTRHDPICCPTHLAGHRFRDGETIARPRNHYSTLGALHRNAGGDVDNAGLVLHWTGADGRALLSPSYIKPGRLKRNGVVR